MDPSDIKRAIQDYATKMTSTGLLIPVQIDNSADTLVPFYRYVRNAYDHFYTTDANEIGTITVGAIGNYGYQYEDIAGYVVAS